MKGGFHKMVSVPIFGRERLRLSCSAKRRFAAQQGSDAMWEASEKTV